MNCYSALRIFAAALLALTLTGPACAAPADPPKPQATDAAPSREAWRAAMMRAPQRMKGCFHAHYPSTQWQAVPCAPPLRRSFAPVTFDVGHGVDFAATVPGTMTRAAGSFDAVNGVTSEAGTGNIPDSYSLQLNSSFFTTTACSGAEIPANCQGWQQFIYSNSGVILMEYWLIHWGNVPCPAGWMSQPPSCVMNSPSVVVPTQPIANLQQLSLGGVADAGSATDTVTFSNISDVYLQTGDDTIINLAQAWNYAEFNIFGDGGGATATFNPGSNLIVRTTVTDGTQNVPNCSGDGITSEKNSLNLVMPCCPYGGPAPAIVFDESNNPNATSMCANGTSIGDTHLTNIDGLLYDFQASGDFLLAETDPKFVVQTRQASGAPIWPNAAVNKAVALQLGASRVALCLEPDRLVVDGKPAALGDGQSLALPGGDGISRSGDSYTFTRAGGQSVRADLNAGWINVTVDLGKQRQARVLGLLGNVNGPMGPNDLASRGGAVVPKPVVFSDLYHPYGDSWRLAPAQSLPAQLCGDRAVERGNPQKLFYARDLDPKVARRTRDVCLAAGVKDAALLEACTLDAAVLGGRDGGKAAAAAFARQHPPRAVLRPLARAAPR